MCLTEKRIIGYLFIIVSNSLDNKSIRTRTKKLITGKNRKKN